MSRILKISVAVALLFSISCTGDLDEGAILDTTRSGVVVEGTIVSTSGDDDTGDGSVLSPYRTLARAIEATEKSGGTILMREGVYREEVSILNSSKSRYITSYPNEKATLSGIEPITTDWSVYSGNIYVTDISELSFEAWQLFEDGKMLNAARWPNVEGFIEDEQPVSYVPRENSMWDQTRVWMASSKTSTEGKMISLDGDKFTSEIDYSLVGASAILNIGSFRTTYAQVTAHTPGVNSFSYDMSQCDKFVDWQKPDMAYYYLEGKLEMLDKAGEWFYDKAAKKLYLWCKDGGNPNDKTIMGKSQSYAITLYNSSNVTIQGVDFIGTTIKGERSPSVTVSGCRFSYPNISKRAVGEYGEYIETTFFDNKSPNVVFMNCIFEYTEGEGIVLQGDNVIVDNCLFRHIDFTCANTRNLGSAVNLLGDGVIMRGSTIYVCGASDSMLLGPGAILSDCEVYSMGHLQNDGAMVQFMIGPAVGSIVMNNWFHDSRRVAFRVDGEKSLDMGWKPGDNQTSCSIYGNVFWNTPGMMVKGDYHFVANNTLFTNDNFPRGLTVMVIINPEGVNSDGQVTGGNHHTLCVNNLVQLISSYYTDERWDRYPMAEGVFNNYVSYFTDNNIYEVMLEDGENRDFRTICSEYTTDKSLATELVIPVGMEKLYENYVNNILNGDDSGSIDLGARENHPEDYRVPGYQVDIATSPIPMDGANSSASSLMLSWCAGYGAEESNIYVGLTYDEVYNATTSSKAYMGSTDKTLFYPLKSQYPLSERVSDYYWRVDSVVDGVVVKGTVWNFKLYGDE